VLSVFGGKITTYRRLAEHALEKLKPYFPHLKKAWTGDAVLPGGAMKDADFDQFLAKLKAEKPFLPDETARRLARAYGTRARDIVGTAQSMADLGEAFDGGLTAAEVDYLRTEEWAVTADDILWRRSKLGLRTSPESAARLAAYLDRRAEAA
jgi:glycerol-3-phosphate dehydrogenase